MPALATRDALFQLCSSVSSNEDASCCQISVYSDTPTEKISRNTPLHPTTLVSSMDSRVEGRLGLARAIDTSFCS